MDERICSNQPYGKHILLRCEGCGSEHHSKNIGGVNRNIVSVSRTIFDIGNGCTCSNQTDYPLIHECIKDDRGW